MGRRVKLGIKNLFSNNYLLYLFVLLFLVMGIIFGVIGVKTLTDQQLAFLGNYIDLGLNNIEKIESQTVAKYAIWRNLETILKIWFLGLTVIGLPLILVIIFTRGFILGFTVGFILENKAWQGLGLVLISILPQNIFHLPALVLAGVAAISFCFYLLNSRKRELQPLFHCFLKYSLIMILLAVVMIFAGLIEGYISPLVKNLI